MDPNSKKWLIFLIIIVIVIIIIWYIYKNNKPKGIEEKGSVLARAGHGGGGGHFGGGGGGHFGGGGGFGGGSHFGGGSGGGFVGHSNAGHVNPGHINPGHTNPGHTNPGHTNPGHNNSGHNNSGHNNPGHTNPGHNNSGHNNPGHHNPGHNGGKFFRHRPAHFRAFSFFPWYRNIWFYTFLYPIGYSFVYPPDYVVVNEDQTIDHSLSDLEALWTTLFTRTRDYFAAALNKTANLKDATENLLQSAYDFGQFYNSSDLNGLVKNHIQTLMDATNSVVQTGKIDNTLRGRLQTTGSQLADAFADLTNVSSADASALMRNYIGFTTQELAAQNDCIKNNQAACVNSSDAYDKLTAYAKTIAKKLGAS